MNIQEYISSGILELYVSGSLPPEQAKEVEANALKYPKIREEIEEISEAIEIFASGFQQTPSSGLLEQIQAKIASQEAGDTRVVNMAEEPSAFSWRWVAIAAAVALLISLAFNFVQYQDLEATEAELFSLSQQQNQMAEQLQQTSQKLQALADPNQVIIDLKGLPISPESYARVFWKKDSEEIFIKVGSLPALTAEQQYQLWAIVDGVPVDAGVFDPVSEVLKLDRPIGGNVQAFAVTLEPRGGSESPTLEQMYISGALG